MKIFLLLFTFIALAFSSCHSHRIARTNLPIDTLDVMLIDTAMLGYTSPLNNVNLQMDLYYSEVSFLGFSKWEEWDLLIRSDSLIELKTIPHGTHTFPLSIPVISQDSNVLHYYSINAEKESLDMTIRKQANSCEDEMGAVDYPFSISILLTTADGKVINYNGCGFYIADPILNDIWAMTALRGKIYEQTSYTNGIPTLEFHLDGMKVYGFGGCNELSGNFYIDSNQQIVFKNISVTLKACPSLESELLFINGINNKSYAYTYEDNRLILTHKDGTAIVFKKVD